jgi:RNA polymerase sigma-70 factor (ECF subfamily)
MALSGVRMSTSETRGELLEHHRPAVQGLCLRLVRCQRRAEELTQETLLIGFTQRHRFHEMELPRAWLLGVARNLCKNERRKRRAAVTIDGFPVVEDTSDSVLERLLTRERDRWVRARAERVLDETQLRAVELRYGEERSEAEIRSTLRLRSASGARGLLQTCRRRLRADLARRRADFQD